MNLQEKIKKQYVFISVILPFKNPRMPLEVAIASMELVVSLTFSSRRTLVEIGGPLPTREWAEFSYSRKKRGCCFMAQRRSGRGGGGEECCSSCGIDSTANRNCRDDYVLIKAYIETSQNKTISEELPEHKYPNTTRGVDYNELPHTTNIVNFNDNQPELEWTCFLLTDRYSSQWILMMRGCSQSRLNWKWRKKNDRCGSHNCPISVWYDWINIRCRRHFGRDILGRSILLRRKICTILSWRNKNPHHYHVPPPPPPTTTTTTTTIIMTMKSS